MQPEFEQPHVIARAPRKLQPPVWTAQGIARAIAEAAAEALAPPRCAGCGWFSPHLFCEQCAPRVRGVAGRAALCECCGERFDALAVIAPGTICARCRGEGGEPASPLSRARSLWLLSGPVRHAVHDFKYRRHSDLAASLGAQLAAFAQRDPVLGGARLIVPVPLHPWREWARGFNQSGLLARHVARAMSIPCADVLWRTRHTPTQTTLSRPARDANVRAAFKVRQNQIAKYLQDEPGPVLLIDDVWTTGATLRECARVLRAAGFERVCALTLARRPRSPAAR